MICLFALVPPYRCSVYCCLSPHCWSGGCSSAAHVKEDQPRQRSRSGMAGSRAVAGGARQDASAKIPPISAAVCTQLRTIHHTSFETSLPGLWDENKTHQTVPLGLVEGKCKSARNTAPLLPLQATPLQAPGSRLQRPETGQVPVRQCGRSWAGERERHLVMCFETFPSFHGSESSAAPFAHWRAPAVVLPSSNERVWGSHQLDGSIPGAVGSTAWQPTAAQTGPPDSGDSPPDDASALHANLTSSTLSTSPSGTHYRPPRFPCFRLSASNTKIQRYHGASIDKKTINKRTVPVVLLERGAWRTDAVCVDRTHDLQMEW